MRLRRLDHDDFGSLRPKIMNVIDPNTLEHDVVRPSFARRSGLREGGKPLRTFRHHALACSLIVALSAGLIVLPGTAAAGPRALVELFTSQGCSSCPPADKLIGELSRDPSLVVLSVAIDYWDYLGWKDTLAVPGNSGRQRGYARMRADRKVYTPQVVVNGSTHVLGSDKAAILGAIEATGKNTDTLSVPVSLSVVDGRVTVSAAAGKSGKPAEVWLCPVKKSVSVPISRGENHGRTVTYHNVVRGWIKLGEWNGAANSWSIPIKHFRTDGIEAVAVLVQAGTPTAPGAVLGAAMTDLDQSVGERSSDSGEESLSK